MQSSTKLLANNMRLNDMKLPFLYVKNVKNTDHYVQPNQTIIIIMLSTDYVPSSMPGL